MKRPSDGWVQLACAALTVRTSLRSLAAEVGGEVDAELGKLAGLLTVGLKARPSRRTPIALPGCRRLDSEARDAGAGHS
jgi:hypothetical protein